MKPRCPRKTCLNRAQPSKVQFHGSYSRSSDSKKIKRWFCQNCKRTFSQATNNPCFGHKKRRLNPEVRDFLESGVSMRQIARKLKIHRTTVARKRRFLSEQGLLANLKLLKKINFDQVRLVQFDDLETFEHSKGKPLSVTLVVTNQRLIIGYKVSRMPCKGRLAAKSRKKYGYRIDERPKNLRALFEDLSNELRPDVTLLSDQNPLYSAPLKEYFPKCTHSTSKSRRAAPIGQGEIKQGFYDPLFAVNHSCAKLRDLIKPLTRRSWCTLKAKFALKEHLNIFIRDHNVSLKLV